LAEKLSRCAQCGLRKAQKMAEPNPEFECLAFAIQAGEECIIVPAEYAIVGTKGIFVRDRHLRVSLLVTEFVSPSGKSHGI